MNLSVQIIDPVRYPEWDEMLLRTAGASFFHSSAWARVLSESYGYTPMYFSIIEDRKLRALVPLMEVNSFLTGKRGVSLPFTDYCEPIVDGSIPFKDLFCLISEYGKKRKWKYIELRGGRSFLPDASASETYLGHSLNLEVGEKKVFANLRDSTQRNIKRAMTQRVDIKISNDPGAVREFYRLNCMTRKKHGLPPQPYDFFQKVYDHIFSKGFGFAALASHNGQNIAGAVFFHLVDKAVYKYGASDTKFQKFRANNLVMWEGIKWFCNNGYKSLSFGRTEPENKGLQQFKTGWGAEENTVNYFRYDLRRMEFRNKQSRVNTLSIKLFHKMPIPVLNFAGSLLYRHMG